VIIGCSRFKSRLSSLNVACASYDGHMWMDAYVGYKNGLRVVSLGIISPEKMAVSLSGSPLNEVQYTFSDEYRDAKMITDSEKGVSFTIMPDGFHGIVKVWKNNNRQPIFSEFVPVLCFKKAK